jgi:N-acyl-D-aspartate/D-glutamate deacylase
VREDSVITLEFAIRKMTSLAAQRVGLVGRGLLQPGMYADITIFDPNTVIDNSTYEHPDLLATGVSYVMVNGVLTMDNGKFTGAVPGRALRSAWYRAHH